MEGGGGGGGARLHITEQNNVRIFGIVAFVKAADERLWYNDRMKTTTRHAET